MPTSSLSVLRSAELRPRLIAIGTFIALFHAAIAVPLLWYSPAHPILLGLVFLSYGLGLRHAVDPDHIAAIDNTTRKLMRDGKTPAGVGFFFALGHSSIVVLMCVLVVMSASFLDKALPAFKELGTLISSVASCIFLLVIGFVNLFILIDTFKEWRKSGKDENPVKNIDDYLGGGILARILRPVLKLVGNSPGMFWVGLLFGLGFDTASEVALLSISGSSGVISMPMEVIILIPLAFTAGMILIDTVNGVLMLGAYSWAFLEPSRKLYYNLTITFASVIIALLIGGIEALQIINRHFSANTPIFSFAEGIHFENWGFYIVIVFLVSWLGSVFLQGRRVR